MSDASATPTPAAPAPSAPSTGTETTSPKGEGMPTEAAAPKAPEASTPPPPPVKKKYKLKVDGQEFEEEVSEDEIPLRLQKARAAEKRFNEAAELQKRLQQAAELIKKDPFEALKDPIFGLDLEALAEKRLAEKYRAERLKQQDPKEYELHQLRQQIEQQKAAEAERQQQYEAQQAQALQQHYAQETFNTFNQAIEKAGLPRDGETLAMMAEIALINLDHGLDLNADQLAAAVQARLEGYTSKAKSRFDSLEGDALLEALGPQTVERVRNHLLAKARSMRGTKPVAPPAPKAEEPTPEPSNKNYVSDTKLWKDLMRG